MKCSSQTQNFHINSSQGSTDRISVHLRVTPSAKPWIKGIYRRETINGKLLFRNENEKSRLRYDPVHRYWIVEILRYDHRAIVDDDPDQNLVLGVFHTSLEKIYNHELNAAFESIERRRVSIWVIWYESYLWLILWLIEIHKSKNYTASLIVCKKLSDESHFREWNSIEKEAWWLIFIVL